MSAYGVLVAAGCLIFVRRPRVHELTPNRRERGTDGRRSAHSFLLPAQTDGARKSTRPSLSPAWTAAGSRTGWLYRVAVPLGTDRPQLLSVMKRHAWARV